MARKMTCKRGKIPGWKKLKSKKNSDIYEFKGGESRSGLRMKIGRQMFQPPGREWIVVLVGFGSSLGVDHLGQFSNQKEAKAFGREWMCKHPRG